MPQKITLKKIAKDLGVSISTVSKALRDSHEISAETREKVKAYAKQYNYRPNNIALSLKNQRTKKIGIIIPEVVHHFFATIVQGAEEIANERGYHVIVCLSNESFDKEVINMEMLANGSIDGFALSIASETLAKKDYHHFNEVINQGMPIVMFDRVAPEVNCDKIVIDDIAAARRATKYLFNKGSKKLAIISTPDHINVGRLRTEGFRGAMEDLGHTISESDILRIGDMTTVPEQIEAFLKTSDHDGILAVNELFAVNTMKQLQQQGKTIPDDVQVISFTDGMLSKYSTPRLTTIGQHGDQMGRKAASLLIDKLEQKEVDLEQETYVTTVLDSSLILRDSTR